MKFQFYYSVCVINPGNYYNKEQIILCSELELTDVCVEQLMLIPVLSTSCDDLLVQKQLKIVLCCSNIDVHFERCVVRKLFAICCSL